MVELPVELGFAQWHTTFQKRQYTGVESLRLIATTFDQLRLNNSKDLVAAARAVADGSKDEGWRLPFGESGILDVAMNIIAPLGIDDDLAKQSLRIIGNTCAQTDANRERVVARNIFPSIITQLQTQPWLALPVLNNITTDYEPAQEAVRKHGLCKALVRLLVTPEDARENISGLLPDICQLLDIATDGEFNAGGCAEDEVVTLLQAASDPDIDVESFVSLVCAVVAHLRIDRFQRLMVTQGLTTYVLDAVVRSYSRNPFLGTSLAKEYPASLPREPSDEDQLSVVRDALISSLSDVSATPEFAENYPTDSDLVRNLCIWLSVSEPSVQLCACFMLGNLARSDVVCKEMVHQIGLHEPLIAILAKNDDLQLLHATLGFLKNLALRVENKGTIAGAGALEGLSKTWSMTSRPQLQYGTVRVVRQLVNGSLTNIQRLLIPLAWGDKATTDDNSYLSQLLALYDKTDDVSIKFEISRIVAAIWRCVMSPASTQYFSDIVDITLPRLDPMAGDLAKPLTAMVTQSRWPVVKSEGWFALALMARSKKGSDAIVDLLSEVELSNALVEVIGSQGVGGTRPVSAAPGSLVSITGADTSELGTEQEKDMETKDRDNAFVLLSELLKNSAARMSDCRRDALEQLLRGSRPEMEMEDSVAALRVAD